MYLRDEDDDLMPLRPIGTAEVATDENQLNTNYIPPNGQDARQKDRTTIEERTGQSVIGAGSNPATEGSDTQDAVPAATLSPEDLQGDH